ncbi:tetratricopeptide repeat protein [Sedimentimonas flavescens]|uniref:Tetratricopeptide repeat protein n=1 Tax=Sedimentimonas flavescens TaxID=2851012 RepID=A0ABT3A0N7_9RHOB|nr:tetratricopeptide repeat protein [Sedimentimonas flavescens]MBW0156563.1 tetratricopeptide repeat protein [Sedimentimonas flavescens]MCV2879501.1 tetratricopeptide repeat protein [Sedimentimonas flavescens]
MRGPTAINKYAVAAFLTLFCSAVTAHSETTGLERYFAELADPDYPGWARAQSDIERAWSRSGSPAMDLLLKRGTEALDAGDLDAAIEHLTALTDHAPDFPEGWNARATAFFVAGRYGPALSDIAQTLRLEPRHWGALNGLGMILDDMEQPERALAAYRASFALNPHQQDVKDAIDMLEKALAGVAL